MTFVPRNAAEHFALQHTTDAAKALEAVAEARAKTAELNRSANETFYHNLTLLSGGTIALSITYLGYLKTLPKVIQHPHWLMASWISLMLCSACSLFWPFVYGRYTHWAMERQYAETVQEKYETEAKEIVNLRQSVANLQTDAQLDAFQQPRIKAAANQAGNAKHSQGRETSYMYFWRLLGWAAHLGFLTGLALLLAFAIRNM